VLGVFLGVGMATGLLMVIREVVRSRRPSLSRRLARFTTARRTVTWLSVFGSPRGPIGTLVELLRPTVEGVGRLTGSRRQARERLTDRLARAGRSTDIVRFRLEQGGWAAAGAMCGVLLVLRGSSTVLMALVLTALPAVGAVLLHDRLLTRAATARTKLISAELPGIAELLAFAVAAGESPLAAMDRVSRMGRGVLTTEIAGALADVRGSMTLEAALRLLPGRCGSPSVSRFVNGILVAIERGTPMADVLRAQAADARAEGRRELMEGAGKRDVFMLVPVVFLILPIVVVIALYPGIQGLHLTSP
jgi:tight adherence protein C